MAEPLSADPARFRPQVLPLPQPVANAMPPLYDAAKRALTDLRISVTDRCNLRCSYCMPKEAFRNYRFLPRSEILSFEEIVRAARLLIALGVRKIRITGGEPLLRQGIVQLVEKLAAFDIELAMTTNGVLLARYAAALQKAGLKRVTVSLDALDAQRFAEITGSQVSVAEVLAGIEAACAAGLTPVKINVVVQRGVNEEEILRIAERFRHTGIVVRFIEFMDSGNVNAWRAEAVLPASEILARLAKRWPLEPVAAQRASEVARYWRYLDGAGTIGIIASVTQPFCRSCTRLRLSTDGLLFTCLFAQVGYDLKSALRAGLSDEELAARLAALWSQRVDRYSELRSAQQAARASPKVEMSYIGG